MIRLALFLRKSKELLCLFDEEWCTRLWCVFELASYLRLREKPKVTFISISQRSLEVIVAVIWSIWTGVASGFGEYIKMDGFAFPFDTSTGEAADINGWNERQNGTISGGNWANIVFFFVIWLGSVGIACVGFILGQKHFRNLAKMRAILETYDVRQAKCCKEADRATLLRFINDIFDNELEEEEAVSDPSRPTTSQSTQFNRGLDAFNMAVRNSVPQQLPMKGIRSVKIATYIVAVFVPFQTNLIRYSSPMYYYDRWAYHTDDADDSNFMYGWSHGAWNGFRYTLGFCFDNFIIVPFACWTFGVLVYLFLMMQEWLMRKTGISYGWTVAIFLPIFVAIETVFCLRPQIIDMIRVVTSFGCIPGPEINEIYNTTWSWFSGVYFLWWVCDPGAKIPIAAYPVQPSATVDVLLWFFLVLPIVFFTLYLYEPRFMREFRAKWWAEFRQRLRNRKPASD